MVCFFGYWFSSSGSTKEMQHTRTQSGCRERNRTTSHHLTSAHPFSGFVSLCAFLRFGVVCIFGYWFSSSGSTKEMQHTRTQSGCRERNRTTSHHLTTSPLRTLNRIMRRDRTPTHVWGRSVWRRSRVSVKGLGLLCQNSTISLSISYKIVSVASKRQSHVTR